ncbi:MAG: 50S ribosome-binding GTPase [Planctomycetota bacterium]|nr:50S ribosome-binding GTPase [Planctomycetota bacterium]
MFTAELDQTIAALASAPGSSGRGIVRVSGIDAVSMVSPVFDFLDATAGSAYRRCGCLRIPGFPPIAADAWVWPTSRSYTGEPMVELHLAGSSPLLERVQETLFQLGVRPARAGEFTLRSFLAGRMDLTQAEAVLGVIDADDHEELTTALNQLAGGLSGKLLQLRRDLLELLADLEAGLDFVEEDIEFVSRREVMRRLQNGIGVVRALEQQADDRMTSVGQLRVVLAGLPNAGKSTLFNALTGSDDAIVSSIAGTTRDYIVAKVDCGELTVELIDTAGLDLSDSGIDVFAQQFRSDQVVEADVVLWCSAMDSEPALRSVDQLQFEKVMASNACVLRVGTRGDLGGDDDCRDDPGDSVHRGSGDDTLISSSGIRSPASLVVSALLGAGLDDLRRQIAVTLSERSQGERQFVGSTVARSRDSLRRSCESLQCASEAADARLGDEIVALETRAAIESLGEIVGAVYTDDLLDQIFSRFCIGK